MGLLFLYIPNWEDFSQNSDFWYIVGLHPSPTPFTLWFWCKGQIQATLMATMVYLKTGYMCVLISCKMMKKDVKRLLRCLGNFLSILERPGKMVKGLQPPPHQPPTPPPRLDEGQRRGCATGLCHHKKYYLCNSCSLSPSHNPCAISPRV